MSFFVKKRNKGDTLHLLDVLVTQHANWTAKRICRGLLGQSLVDFRQEVDRVFSYKSLQRVFVLRRKERCQRRFLDFCEGLLSLD